MVRFLLYYYMQCPFDLGNASLILSSIKKIRGGCTEGVYVGSVGFIASSLKDRANFNDI